MLIEACVNISHMERIFYFEEKVKMVTFPWPFRCCPFLNSDVLLLLTMDSLLFSPVSRTFLLSFPLTGFEGILSKSTLSDLTHELSLFQDMQPKTIRFLFPGLSE